LQKPHSKKSEVISAKMTAKFLPSETRNRPALGRSGLEIVVDPAVEVFICSSPMKPESS
jgi:hypothetical protein